MNSNSAPRFRLVISPRKKKKSAGRLRPNPRKDWTDWRDLADALYRFDLFDRLDGLDFSASEDAFDTTHTLSLVIPCEATDEPSEVLAIEAVNVKAIAAAIRKQVGDRL